MSNLRLGDIIDDYCIKCRRLTNHAIVSMLGEEVAKVRCRSCYHEHMYIHEQIPPSKKDLKKLELFNSVLATVDPSAAEIAPAPADLPETGLAEDEVPAALLPAAEPAKKVRGRAKKA
jgi:hypothetical protein